MNKQEYLFTVLAEECAELAQECAKVNRFGLDSISPLDPRSMSDRLSDEFIDVIAMMEMLSDAGILSVKFDQSYGEKLQEKKDKVNKYMAIHLGGNDGS